MSADLLGVRCGRDLLSASARLPWEEYMGVRLVPLAMAVVVAPALLCAQAPTSPQTAFHFRCGAGTGLQVQLGPAVTWSHQRGYGFRTPLAGSSRNACSSDKPFIFDVALPEGDLNAMSRQFYEAMGPEKSVKAFVHYPAGTYPDQKVELTDDTHFNNYGAYEMARMIVQGLKESGLPLARELMDGIPRFDPLHPDSIEAFRLPASPVPENHHYVFSYFQGNGEDGLHLAYSTDGLTWRALKHDSAFFKPTVGVEKLTRDPSIVRGPDGTYHMVWTAGWNEHGFGYAESKDLVAWTNETYVPAMAYEPTALNTWAPELFYDSSNGRYLIYWATTIPGRDPSTDAAGGGGKYNHRLYYVSTTDFRTFTPAKLLYEHGFSVIDADIIHDGTRYVMFLKDETERPPQKNIRLSYADHAEGPWSAPSAPITGDYWAEGTTALRVEGQWIVYFDRYREHKYGALASTDLETWTDASAALVLPNGIRHGTAFEIPSADAARLLEHAGP